MHLSYVAKYNGKRVSVTDLQVELATSLYLILCARG